jgi:hypothetical protein
MDLVSNNKHSEQSRARVAKLQASRRRGGLMGGIITAALLVILGVGGWMAYAFYNAPESQGIDKSNYQAVFLTNGQVYFGKLQNTRGEYLTLTNIYYLQVQQTVQPAEANPIADQGETQLVKLGNELHGPQDSMKISDKQVLFWENLKADSKVGQAIAGYKAAK